MLDWQLIATAPFEKIADDPSEPLATELPSRSR
jgi:hypothetical protein